MTHTMVWNNGHTMHDLEQYIIIETLKSFNGNRTQTAKALDISIRTVRNKIIEYRAAGEEIPRAKQARKETVLESPKEA